MPAPRDPVGTFTVLPDPGQAGTLDDLVERLRLLKSWAGDPSYETIKDRINAAWVEAGRPAGELVGKTTIVDCFRSGRRRLNTELVVAVVQVLHPDVGYVTQWRQALRVIGGETRAASQVRVQDSLPQGLAQFTGRTIELDWLRQVLRQGRQAGNAVVISAIEGMAGVGKTQLAIHAGHVLADEQPFDHVLFVNLRGFHPDPTQPPADPAAVLEGFLRLLGVAGHEVPYDLDGRAALYRECLAGTRALVILDNAATEDQARSLLADSPGCLTLITSRRSLTDLDTATHLKVDVFTPEEAMDFLDHAAPQVPVGQDPGALARIARRCGYLPLALGLVAGHIRGTPGWTLTDHADRLDERHHARRLDTGVELALDLSYRHLPTDQQRLLRLVALHPGQDFDAHASSALIGADLPAAEALLHRLHSDHLVHQNAPGRYTFHDLVRAYAVGRAGDEDRPPERHAALTRLFDYYLATAAAAMDALHPAETHRRPRISPIGTEMPTLTEPDAARAWLDTERLTLVAVAAYTAAHGWPTHTTRLSTTLFRYLAGGHFADALAIHGHAREAAYRTDDQTGQANALLGLGVTHTMQGRHGPAAEHVQQALLLYRQTGDRTGEARALGNLANIELQLGRYVLAADHIHQALTLYQQDGDRTGEAYAVNSLGEVEERLGRYEAALDHHQQALVLYGQLGSHIGAASALNGVGQAEIRLGRYEPAADNLHQALAAYRRLGNRDGEAWTLDTLGVLYTQLNQPGQAAEHHQQALDIFRETGDAQGEAWAHNGLGEAAPAADAVTHHAEALTIATGSGIRDQEARAHAGLGRAHQALGDPTQAHGHYQYALALFTELGMPDADHVRSQLGAITGEST